TPPPSFSYLFPEPLGPHRWRGVLRQEDRYRLYLVDSLSGRADLKMEIRTEENEPRIHDARKSEWGRRLEAFFKPPVWQARDGAAAVYDLRFASLVLPREPVFTFRLRFNGAGWERAR